MTIMFTSMTSRLVSVIFKMANKELVKVMGKKFEYLTDVLFQFLRFGGPYCRDPDLKSLLS